MMEYIKECLQPIYRIHWLDTIYLDVEHNNSVVTYIACQDNRLLKVL